MSLKIKLTTRQQKAMDKRAKILSSVAFREWWAARSDISPIPSDPYRAFMIDLGLKAKVLPKPWWMFRTNRSDYPPYDYPRGIPLDKRRTPSKKQLKRWKKMPKPAQPLVRTPYEKELVKMLRVAEEKYHLPKARIRIEPRARASYIPSVFGDRPPQILLPRELVKTGEMGKLPRIQVEAIAGHEFGHHAHAAYGGIGKLGKEMTGALSPVIAGRPYVLGRGKRAETLAKERVAWEIAKAARIAAGKEWKPQASWLKKAFLGTYLGTVDLYGRRERRH